jgi:hypothetical protein
VSGERGGAWSDARSVGRDKVRPLPGRRSRERNGGRVPPPRVVVMPRGAFCLSIDFELAWGMWDRPAREYFQLCAEKEPSIVERLLALFQAYEISATWAIVARLLERKGPIPVQTLEGERIWYAPGLVDAIRRATPAQDIGSHTYAHIYFDTCGRDAIRDDLENAHRVHREHQLDFTSFVFPRNQVAHVDLLADAGLGVFRGIDVGWHTAVERKAGLLAGRIANLADKIVPVSPAVVHPLARQGAMVELPSSMILIDRSGIRRLARTQVIEAKARRGLTATERDGGIFHLWFHPSNFYYDTDVQFGVLERILRLAAGMRDRGQLDIRPMNSYARPNLPS